MTTDINTIWNHFHKELSAFIQSKTHNKADSDDILQDIFVKVIDNIDKVTQAHNVRAYLYAITRNSINDYFRNKKKETAQTALVKELTESESQILAETIEDCCLRPMLQKLPENYREALVLAEVENLSQKELAEKLHISYSGAKSRVQRGREKLKEMLVGCCKRDVYGNRLEQGDDCNCG